MEVRIWKQSTVSRVPTIALEDLMIELKIEASKTHNC